MHKNAHEYVAAFPFPMFSLFSRRNNPLIAAYMSEQNNSEEYTTLANIYVTRLLEIIQGLPQNTR